MINTDNMYNDKGEARESINFMSTVADCFYLKKKTLFTRAQVVGECLTWALLEYILLAI